MEVVKLQCFRTITKGQFLTADSRLGILTRALQIILGWKTRVERVVQQEIKLYLHGTSIKLLRESLKVSCTQSMET